MNRKVKMSKSVLYGIISIVIVLAIVCLLLGVSLASANSKLKEETTTGESALQTTIRDYDPLLDEIHTHVDITTERVTEDSESYVDWYGKKVMVEDMPIYDFTEEELDLMARLIQSEGGIESYETKLKIGSVVLNRVLDPNFPNTLSEVIYQKNQFSVTWLKIDGKYMIENTASEEATKAAFEVLTYGSVLPDKVQVFYNKNVSSGWATTRQPYGTYDNTTFAYIYERDLV